MSDTLKLVYLLYTAIMYKPRLLVTVILKQMNVMVYLM